MECPDGKLKPVAAASLKPSGLGRWMMNLSTWLMRTTNPRFTAQHQPGLRPGANAATATSRASSVTGVASAEKLSMMGVSMGVRRCWTMSQ